MKKLILIFFIVISISAYAQKELYGTWTVTCPFEYNDKATTVQCSLCPTEHKSESSIIIKDFEMTVDIDKITLNINDSATKVKYIWDSEIHAIEFTFKQQKYKFKTLYNGNEPNYILKDDDGILLMLYKKK